MLIAGNARAYVCAEPCDMRKAIDGLAALVRPVFGGEPLSGHLFVFMSRQRNKVKVLYWDRHGFALWYKRLERGRFPRPDELALRGISLAELSAWLEGIDLSRTRRFKPLEITRIA